MFDPVFIISEHGHPERNFVGPVISHVPLIGHSELDVSVNVSMNGDLSVCCRPVIARQPLQGIPSLSPCDSWDSLQSHRDPELNRLKEIKKKNKKQHIAFNC